MEGISLASLATQTGIGERRLERILCGRRALRPGDLPRVCDALRREMSSLVMLANGDRVLVMEVLVEMIADLLSLPEWAAKDTKPDA